MRVLIDLQACQSPSGRVRGVGRYCLSLSIAMARAARGHEIWIAVNSRMPESIVALRDQFEGILPPERIVCFESVGPTASMDDANLSRNAVAELLREDFIERFDADVVLVASMIDGYADSVITSVRANSRALHAAIVFDLIPLIMPDIYLARDGITEWYARKLGHLKRCDLLLGISAFTSEEATQLLDLPEGRVVNISAAVGEEFRRIDGPISISAVGRKHAIDRPFVMYAGGFDPRKNLARLIEAYARLPDDVREAHQIVLVGGIGSVERDALCAVREQFGIPSEDLVFTGFVPDEELIRLYNSCALYVFPSTHEGFGLPALEAMSCGAVVIGANTTSLPEVIGVEEALFDPYDIDSIKRKLHEGLTDAAFRTRMREHASVQAKEFSWVASASAAWDAIEGALASTTRNVERAAATFIGNGRQVAVLATEGLVPAHLAGLIGPDVAGVTVFSDNQSSLFADGDAPAQWKVQPLSGFSSSLFDDVVIQVRDSEDTVGLLAEMRSGSCVLLLQDATANRIAASWRTHDKEALSAALYGWGGYAALSALSSDGPLSMPPSALAFAAPGWHAMAPGGVPHTRPSDRQLDLIAGAPGVIAWNGDDLAQLAYALTGNTSPRSDGRVLYVDISNLVMTDAKTGIQRVVRHILAELLAAPPEGYRVEPVYVHDDGAFRFAQRYTAERFHSEVEFSGDEVVDFLQGDIFLGLDLAAHLIPAHRDMFVRMRARGVEVSFVVYDLLPLLRPDCFDDFNLPIFRAWYEAIAELADGIVCISRTVADEFMRWLPQAMPTRGRPLRLGYFHLGADLLPPQDAVEAGTVLPFDLRGRPTFLMVGTIEPRKGHAQTLAAFEELWRLGHDVNLVLIGKPGWRVEKLVDRLRRHEQADRRLFWLEKADDATLVAMYQRASALLAASEGEGFGLPLIEAAQYGLPIVARDLPVFQEVAGDHAFYFHGMDPQSMADGLTHWLSLSANGTAPASRDMPWLTWRQSAAQLADVVVRSSWYDSWTPAGGRRFHATDHRADSTTGQLMRGQRVTSGAPGLLYGTTPFKMGAGRYQVRVLGQRMGGGQAWVDVEAHGGGWRLASMELTTGDGTVGLVDVSLDEDVVDLRIRVMVDATAVVTLNGIEIAPAANAVAMGSLRA
jgi:glycosyltransferase involved in cell wall biosynthesis